jgi:hypothetical protein
MCTLIVFHHGLADAEFVIAANRDEYLDRPAEPPALRFWHAQGARTADARAGGTWLGATTPASSLDHQPPDPTPDGSPLARLLVVDALAASSAAEAAARLAQLPARSYNPFNLLVCDARDAFVVVYEEKAELRRLSAGPHVIGNGDPDSRRLPKVARLLDEADAIPRGSALEALAALEATCATHESAGAPSRRPAFTPAPTERAAPRCCRAGDAGTRTCSASRMDRPAASPIETSPRS